MASLLGNTSVYVRGDSNSSLTGGARNLEEMLLRTVQLQLMLIKSKDHWCGFETGMDLLCLNFFGLVKRSTGKQAVMDRAGTSLHRSMCL
jgi:hypothetical protein